MKPKLTLEQFLEIRKQLTDLEKEKNQEESVYEEQIKEIKNKYKWHPYYDMESELEPIKKMIDKIEENYYYKTISIQSVLLNYDLSDIPFGAWKNFIFYGDDNHFIDFSNTNANLDFSIITVCNCKDYNFKNCNVKNIEEIYGLTANSFDEKVINSNPDLFLSGFSEDFRKKYFDLNVTLDDLSKLSDDEIDKLNPDLDEHMESNGLMYHLFFDLLGLKKIVELYRYSKEECIDVLELASKSRYTKEICELISNTDIINVKNTCYNYLRNKMLYSKDYIYLEGYTQQFINENEDIFLIGLNIPDEVKERFFFKELKINDFVSYPLMFQNMPLDYFLDENNEKISKIIGFIRKNYGVGEFQKLIQKHKNIFLYLEQNNKFDRLLDFLVKRSDLEKDFKNIIRCYLSAYHCDNQGLKDIDWLTSMQFQYKNIELDKLTENADMLNAINDNNVVFKLDKDMAWIMHFLGNGESSNLLCMKIIAEYAKISNKEIKKVYKNYIIDHFDDINNKKASATVNMITEVLSRLGYSNANEIRAYSGTIATQLLNSDDPLGNLNKIENVFLRNNLPLCGKMFLYFKILYPSFSNVKHNTLTFDKKSRVAPSFKDDSLPDVGFNATNEEKRSIITFNDLLRISYRSNERSLIEYIDNIELGNKLFIELQNNGFDTTKLSDEERKVLEIFASHLEVLSQNFQQLKKTNISLNKLSLEEKLKLFNSEFKETSRYDLKDRIVRSFCYYAGIKSFDELKQLTEESFKEQEERINKFLEELEKNNGKFVLQEGDFVRGIGELEALSGSIGTGNFSKEHLGLFLSKSDSDTTPLDIDITLVTGGNSIYNAIKGTPTGFGFGNVYFVIKKGNPNFYISRDENGNLTGEKYDPKKVELFGTKVDNRGYITHWGARTGVSLVDIDCILYKKSLKIDDANPYDENGNVNYENDNNNYDFELAAIKYEIAKHGYYIPIIDFSGELIYTKDEFKKLREKMQGLSYFKENNYKLSDKLITPEVEEIANTINEDTKKDILEKRLKINAVLNEVLQEMGLDLKTQISNDLTEGSVELIDTGSTGRETNVPYDGDFDLYMRIDAKIIRDYEMFKNFKNKIMEKLNQYDIKEFKLTSTGDFRIKKIQLDDDTVVDIDISFGVKTNKVSYSSDLCLKDRLETIKKLYPDQYKYVIANIVQAKSFLKDDKVNAYKSRRSDPGQGGLGGIGVENWILQNGGSFLQASYSFVNNAFDKSGKLIPFNEFIKKYEIWDFGENHFSARDESKSNYNSSDEDEKSTYLYDNFVSKNMNEAGYKKMANALKEYLIMKENEQKIDEIIKR